MSKYHIAPTGALHPSPDAMEAAERVIGQMRPVPPPHREPAPVVVLDAYRHDEAAALRAEVARLERALADHARDLAWLRAQNAMLREQNAELRRLRAEAVERADQAASDVADIGAAVQRLDAYMREHFPGIDMGDTGLIDATIRVLGKLRGPDVARGRCGAIVDADGCAGPAGHIPDQETLHRIAMRCSDKAMAGADDPGIAAVMREGR